MSSVSASGRSSGKTIITVVLVVIAVLAIVAGISYFIEPAHSLPSFMGKLTHPPASLVEGAEWLLDEAARGDATG